LRCRSFDVGLFARGRGGEHQLRRMTIQLLGSDSFNSLMGTNYFGVVFSE
jgi:hypothetical protein